MCPALRPVLPGMHRRVGADEAVAPVGGRTVAVVPLRGFLIGSALVAEEAAEWLQRGRAVNPAVPVVMADLVAE